MIQECKCNLLVCSMCTYRNLSESKFLPMIPNLIKNFHPISEKTDDPQYRTYLKASIPPFFECAMKDIEHGNN